MAASIEYIEVTSRRVRVIDIEAMGKRNFWSLMEKRGQDECWPWIGKKTKDGYGEIWVGKTPFIASRVAWALANQKQPEGFVCHSCDNPVCCNPKHLWLGSPKDNVSDMIKKRRGSWQHQTHCKNGHEFTTENTYRAPKQPNRRSCRACERGRARRRAAELKTAKVTANE